MSQELFAGVPIKIAVVDDLQSKQMQLAWNCDYIKYGSDRFEYDLDSWRNSLKNQLDIEFVPYGKHSATECSIIVGHYERWQSLPQGPLPHFAQWLSLFQYIADEYNYTKELDRIKKINRLKLNVYYMSYDGFNYLQSVNLISLTIPEDPPLPPKSPFKNWQLE